jgi:hypothetical protein
MKKIIPIISFVFGAVTILSAQTLYEEPFATGGSSQTLANFGWATTGDFSVYGYSGVFYYSALQNAVTSQPINGQSAVYMGSGAAVNEGFFTTDGSNSLSGFTDITFTGSLTFGIYDQIASGAGNSGNETAYFMVQDGGNWYASANPMSGPTDTGALMDQQTMTLSPSAANWVTISGISTSSISFGSTPGSNLGSTITGAGIVFSLNNSSYDTFNYADFTISAVPEPGSIALASLGGLLFALRRKRS